MTNSEKILIAALSKVSLGKRPGIARMCNYLAGLLQVDPDRTLSNGQADFLWQIAYRYRGQLKAHLAPELFAKVLAVPQVARPGQATGIYYALATPQQLRLI